MNQNEMFRFLSVGLPEDIARRKAWGDLEGAIRLIDRELRRQDLPEALRNCMTVEREIMCRIPEDYPLTRADALAEVRQHIPDFTEKEFDERVDAGKIGWVYLNGEMHFFNRFFSSMCKAEPAFAQRAGVMMHGVESVTREEGEGRLDRVARLMRQNGSMTNRIRIRASVRVKDECFSPGMFVRAHLPIPAACEQQSDIRIEKIFPETGRVAPEDAAQRTVCWEETMTENHPFVVEYSYLHTATYHDLSDVRADSVQPTFDTEEIAPHVVFTPFIHSLVDKLTKGTDNPLEKARRFYDFITLQMRYNFMPSYFILEDIAQSCARSYTGDCGVFALLFLTLCRCAGIPAQWQSGLTAEPDFIGGHDWVRFYIAPYGWLFADPSYGTAAVRAQNEERRRFYFGNLDAYRMVANREFQAPFTVPKQYWRMDPYDNQLGEIETDKRGLRSYEFERSKEILLCEEQEEAIG
ncbi:MAG: transglutaminase domain-containing protein [Oscillospiraceae bacterium]|nr:transglutaminase domain-containing protein [Oscillospiraceae bacterium]MBQ1805503.1 transglutaminase domain-containing protein [Oscillospiraceae bacterium]MBQ1835345.1 transglutaminase domain-containing protein [Oscillospiraceae bacterium]MBQ2607091.1 transglutaminase domain-containing protein [Oscillospiraceae bacterium]MBQ5442582.1 transglutaminase domain-containing protein [Oscillospiraceae bacterium]